MFNVSGTQVNPVTGVTIRGLTIRDAALTFLGTTPAECISFQLQAIGQFNDQEQCFLKAPNILPLRATT